MAHSIHGDRRKEWADNPELSIYSTGDARFNAATAKGPLAGVESAGFEPDPEADELCVILGENGDDAKPLREEYGGRGIYACDLLSEFGVSSRDIHETVHLPVENDLDRGILVVDMEPLLEVVGDADG